MKDAHIESDMKDDIDDGSYVSAAEHAKLQKLAAVLADDNRRLREVINKLRNAISFVETAVQAVCEKYMPEDR